MEQNTLPISKPVKFNDLKGGELDVQISATPQDLIELAKAYSLLEVKSFSVALNVAIWHKTGIEVLGRLDSKIVQECVATLEPVENSISLEFRTRFIPEQDSHKFQDPLGEDGVIEIDLNQIDPPEIYNGTDIDLGKIATEQFALSIEPFPRAEGASFEEFLSETVDSEFVNSRQPSAFAELAELKRKLK